jgi:hypothetical protein
MENLYTAFPTSLCVSLAKVRMIQWVRLLLKAVIKITEHYGRVCICKLILVMLSKTEVQQQQGIRKDLLLPYKEHVYVTVSTVYYPRSWVRTRTKPSDFSG